MSLGTFVFCTLFGIAISFLSFAFGMHVANTQRHELEKSYVPPIEASLDIFDLEGEEIKPLGQSIGKHSIGGNRASRKLPKLGE